MEAGRIAPSCVLPVFPSAAKGGKAHGESRHAAQMDSGAADRGHGRAGGRILVVDHVDAAVAAQITSHRLPCPCKSSLVCVNAKKRRP